MNGLLGSPVARHEIGPNAISCVVEFHKWNITPMTIKIGTCQLLVENRTYVVHYKFEVFSHPPRGIFRHGTLITKGDRLPGVISLSNLINSGIYIFSTLLGYIVKAVLC